MRIFISASIAALTLTSAHAEIIATQTVEKEVIVRDDAGVEKLQRIKAEKVTPGEQIIYSLRFENRSDASAETLSLVMPVPAEVIYVEGSVEGMAANVTFSADGGETYVARGRLTVEESGEARPATGDEITHIRWKLANSLAPHAEGEVSYRGVLK